MILAAVSIALVMNSGIINKAKYGVDKYSEEQSKEQQEIGNIDMFMARQMLGENELLDDDIYPSLKAFITVWKTTEANETVTIPIRNINVDINWGDNSPTEHITTNNPTHSYAEPGKYEVSITGRVYGFYGNTTQLTGIKQWGTLGYVFLRFDNCTNLTGAIPEPSKNSFSSLYNSDEGSFRFKGCSSLTGPISEKLLYNVKITYFREMFSGCSSLTAIPENLFSKNSEVVNFRSVFAGCTGITTIPEKLFKNNTKATNFNSVFSQCAGITLIPEKLFENNINAMDFSCAFYRSGIISIPEKIFENQKNIAQLFTGCFGGCVNLENIPSGLFKNCTAATRFDTVFIGCSKIKNIPDRLFENCEKAETFRQALQGVKTTVIPKDLFKGCNSITNLSDLFTNNRNLEGKEVELDIESNNVTSFYQMFYNTGISKVTLNVPENSTTYNTISTNNNTYANNLIINTF